GEVVKNEDVEVGKTTTAPADLQKDGYHLDGWYTNDSYTGDKYDFTTPVNDNLNLYAKWVKDEPTPPTEKYTVTYTDGVPNEEIFKDQVTSNILTGSKTPAFNGTPTRSGYTFADWTPTVEETVTKDIIYKATWTKNNTPTTPTTPVTPTPSEEHKVTITPNNGDPDITQTVPDGGKAVEPDDLTNDGYKLDGWYTDSTMTQPFDFSQPIKSDIHIYAKWTKTNEPVTPAKPSKKVSGILLPKVIAKGKHTQTLTWTALKNVDGYFIYTNHCDEGKKLHPFKKVADYKASKARVYTRKNLKTYHNYKYYVAAYKIKNGKKVVVRNSVTVHSVCGNTSARSTNVKSVKVKKHAVTLKKGKTYKVKATISKVNKKRAFLDATHCGLLRYLTADSKIADVNYNTGVIKAKKAGKTTVYVLGVNGIRDKVTVTVK
ncbi:MAG: InlB B-repeat-containing protein, partial [Clostridiales bacterium]|nr:InlB B-repeat-containing protein [Clostridiales bacterium]